LAEIGEDWFPLAVYLSIYIDQHIPKMASILINII